MKQEKGFTLIELLVVIAIIALLLSILMPALGKAKEKAEIIICGTKLRNYSAAIEMYLNDNNDNFPAGHDILWKSLDYHTWHNEDMNIENNPDNAGTIWQYVPDMDMHLCTTFARFAKKSISEHEAYTVSQSQGPCGSIEMNPIYSYGMNNLLGPSSGSVHKRTQVKMASTTFLFSEENMWVTPGINGHTLNDTAICASFNYNDPRNLPPPFIDSFGSFHGTSYSKRDEGKANAVFVDGHVERVEPEDSYRLAKPR